MSKTIGLLLEPLDVLFFRDARPFTASSRGASGLPAPQTLAGALRTALLEQAGCDLSRLRGGTFADAVRASCGPDHHWLGDVAVRGPWLARRRADRPEDLEVLTPVPATLHTRKKQPDGRLYPLRPLRTGELPGWRPGEGRSELRPLWLRERLATEPAEGYLTPAGLRAFLRGEEVTGAEVVRRGELFDFDHRTGIGIEPDRLSAQESLIYGASFLALREHVALYAEVVVPDEHVGVLASLSVLSLGGEGRRVRISAVPRFSWPEVSGLGKSLVLLTTPGLFRGRWRPDRLPGPLAAAAVPGALAVSGWDLARGGPKPARFAAPAGSVYFLDGALDGLPPDSLCDAPEDRLQGWGCCLKGVWTDA
jgi:CRISPR-associated protein Cmr3